MFLGMYIVHPEKTFKVSAGSIFVLTIFEVQFCYAIMQLGLHEVVLLCNTEGRESVGEILTICWYLPY